MGDDRVLHARHTHVLFQDFHGYFAEHSPARNVHDHLYRRIPREGADTDLHLRLSERIVCGICPLVGTVSLYLGDPLGGNHVVPEKYARQGQMRGVSRALLLARLGVRRFIRTRLYADVRSEL